MAHQDSDKLPLQKPTPLTWLYVAFAIAVVVLTVWGFINAGTM